MKQITEDDEKLIDTLKYIQEILVDEGEIDFFDAIDIAEKITQHIEHQYVK